MPTLQAGVVYRYLRADADHDISADLFEVTMTADENNWHAATYIAPGSWPASVIAVQANVKYAAKAGLTGYWYRILTGPGQTYPLKLGVNNLRGRATDTPESPHFGWSIRVAATE